MWSRKPKRQAKGTQIEWKDPNVGPKGTARQHIPNRFVAPKAISEDVIDFLRIGAPVMVTIDMELAKDRGVYPFSPLMRYNGEPGKAPIPRGSLLMYAGTVRATERKRIQNKTIDIWVLKHTFVTPLGRCILHDLRYIQPVQ